MMEFQGYIGKVEFDDEAGIFHGEVVNTRDVITFQADNVAGLRKAFRESVDDYLAFCAERGEKPDRPYSGQFVTRTSPELHRQASVAAALADKSLNAWVCDQLEQAVAKASVAKVRKNPVRENGNRKQRAARRRPSVKR